uniref:Uncharacterized protein n=1 Tax=Anguilla anguilla TaxID=7936 RepID=A0A0E9W051_ANGAN
MWCQYWFALSRLVVLFTHQGYYN